MLFRLHKLPTLAARRDSRGRVIRAGVAFVSILMVGTGGYFLLGRGAWSLFDCLYMTVVTLTTVGYGEVLPLAAVPGARLFTVFLIIIGMGLVLYLMSTFTAFLVDGSLGSIFQRRKMLKQLDQMKGHYIICGVGKTGIHVVEELVETGYHCVALDQREERIEAIAERYGPGVPAIVGDATHDGDLITAGVERATGLVASLGAEVENVYCTLSARQLNPTIRIIVRSDNPQAEQKFIHAGADSVVYTSLIGGRRIASEMVRPEVVSFLDLMIRDKERTMRIEEVTIPPGSPVKGKSLTEANLRRFGDILVIAIRATESEIYTYNPGPSRILEENDVLILLGEMSCVREVKHFVS